jgi:hypothetical protein
MHCDTFSPLLQLLRDAQPRLRLYSNSFAYNFPNVSTELGNGTLRIDRMGLSNQMIYRHIVTFQTGLYGSLDDIQRIIQHSLHQYVNFSDLDITLIGVAATRKVRIVIVNGHAGNMKLEFSLAGSIGSLLGFTDDKYFSPISTTSRQSDTTASLDHTTSVLVQSPLCQGSVVAGQGGGEHVGNDTFGSICASDRGQFYPYDHARSARANTGFKCNQ